MDTCLTAGGPALCTVSAIVCLLALSLMVAMVQYRQCVLLLQRFRAPAGKWRRGKAIIFYAILMENIVTLVHGIMFGTASSVTHLLKDYSQFLLFTSLFYYFALHTFQIMGDSRLTQCAIWSGTVMNILYLSAFTAYDAYVIVKKRTTHFCKSEDHADPLWLSMRASACFVSLLLVGVGLFASHYLNKRRERVNKQREMKLWIVIFMMVAATFIQLAYDIYQELVMPNPLCIGLLSVLLTQKQHEVANALIWFFDKLICTFSVDFCCMFALWRKKKTRLPLLASPESDDPVIISISAKPLKGSVGSDSSASAEDDDRFKVSTKLDDIN